jgi:hypothetical protein
LIRGFDFPDMQFRMSNEGREFSEISELQAFNRSVLIFVQGRFGAVSGELAKP